MSQAIRKNRSVFPEVEQHDGVQPSLVLMRMLEVAEGKIMQQREIKLRKVKSARQLPRPFAYD